MVRLSVILLVFGRLLLFSYGQEKDAFPYPEGEKLFFDLSYGWIKGGEGVMQYHTVVRDSDTMAVVRAEAHTTGIFSWFSPVEDRSETHFRAEDGYPVRSVREIRRRGKTSSEELLFLEDNHRIRSSRSGDHLFPVRMYDVLSAFYRARSMLSRHLPAEGSILRLPLFFDGKYFDVRVRYDGKEEIRTFEGRKMCYRFVPDTTGNRTFTDPEQLRIWVTDDGRLLPVRIVARLPVGSFRCVLTGVQ